MDYIIALRETGNSFTVSQPSERRSTQTTSCEAGLDVYLGNRSGTSLERVAMMIASLGFRFKTLRVWRVRSRGILKSVRTKGSSGVKHAHLLRRRTLKIKERSNE